MSGPTGYNLLKLLESRLDNSVYRLGLAPTRRAARQLISHKHFLVNNRTVNIPSFLLKPGDVVQVRDRAKKMEIFHESMRRIQSDNPMPWLTIDKAKLQGHFITVPEREQIPEPINEQMVVELYSK
jgi:small subunit ribosomal protein S4